MTLRFCKDIGVQGVLRSQTEETTSSYGAYVQIS